MVLSPRRTSCSFAAHLRAVVSAGLRSAAIWFETPRLGRAAACRRQRLRDRTEPSQEGLARRLYLRKMPFSFVAADSLYDRARLKPCCGGGQRAAIARAIMRRLILGFVAKSTSLGTCAAFEVSGFLDPPFGRHSARVHSHAAHMERTLRFVSRSRSSMTRIALIAERFQRVTHAQCRVTRRHLTAPDPGSPASAAALYRRSLPPASNPSCAVCCQTVRREIAPPRPRPLPRKHQTDALLDFSQRRSPQRQRRFSRRGTNHQIPNHGHPWIQNFQ